MPSSPSWSVQLYSVRHELEADLEGTVRRLAEIGYTLAEPFAITSRPDELARALSAHGIGAPTAHVGLVAADDAALQAVFAAAAALGVGTVVEPAVRAEHWQDAGSVRATAERLNAVAAQAAGHGLRVGYHNHWWELEAQVDGTTGLEALASMLDPGVVLEVDTYWAAVGGQDPVALLGRLGERVVAIHVKDGPVTRDTKAQLPAGSGAMDVWGVVRAVPGLEVAVVEFDDYVGDVLEGVQASLRYLQAGPR